MSISFDSGLGDQVRDAARRAGTGLSSWLAGAAAARLRAEALEEFLGTWEKKHGTLTAAELSQAEGELGVGAPKKSRRWAPSSWTQVPSSRWTGMTAQ